jgi:hypothetical protein
MGSSAHRLSPDLGDGRPAVRRGVRHLAGARRVRPGDVIIAPAAQARLAVKESGIPLQIDFTGLADTSCTEARPTAEAAYQGTGPWQPAERPHCRELVASALAEIQVQAGVAAGMPPSYVDLICRGKAVGGAA